MAHTGGRPRSGGRKPTWFSPGSSVTVAGHTLPEGMVYVGAVSEASGDLQDCVIDPARPVASGAPGPLGYWPRYARISRECRNQYLDWLASGRQDRSADIGYVFLFFYGLERRLLLDRPSDAEIGALLAELQRLRGIYAESRSFDGYSHRLIEAVEFIRDPRAKVYIPDLSGPLGEMPLRLQLAVAREVKANRPLSFELAAAALIGMRDFWQAHRKVLDKIRPAFLRVLRPRFEQIFPRGYKPGRGSGATLNLVYRGAMAGLSIDLTARANTADLPDPGKLDWSGLLTLANAVADELAPQAKAIAYHPARAASLTALIACPPEIQDTVASEAKAWLQSLSSAAAVSFGELAGHAMGTQEAKWTMRHRKQVSQALAAVGYAVEPDPEDGAEHLEDGTMVQVFRCADHSRSRGLEVASAAAMLVAGLASRETDQGVAAVNEWCERAGSQLGLSPGQAVRLRAKIAWLRTKPLSLAKVLRMLGDASPDEREFCAHSAAAVAVSSGAVDKANLAALEKICDRIGVPRGSLYSALHSGLGQASPAADEPVIIVPSTPEVLHPIPAEPAAPPAPDGAERLARIRAETERVSAMLAQVFVTEDEPEIAAPSTGNGGAFDGLDAEHASLLQALLKQSEWSRDAFDTEARHAGLMPDGAMEAINEWAFDHFDDALLEDGEIVAVNASLLGSNVAEAAE